MQQNLPTKPVKGIFPVFQTIFLLLLSAGVFGQTNQTFTSSGSWTVPCGVTSVTIGLWGGGGAGGGSTSNNSGGSGGGGGAYVINTFAVSSGDVITYTIGAGGLGSTGTGGSGTSSTLSGPFGVMSASFGTGGSANQGLAGIGGTIGSGGTVTNGTNGNLGTTSGGNGGVGGNGGNGGLGTSNANGQPGVIPGAGGGGGERAGSSSIGGNGANGQVRFTYSVINSTVNAGSPQTVCQGGTITLAGSLTGIYTSATWSGGSGTFSDINNLGSTYTPSITSGLETLTLTATDPDGAGPCTSSLATVLITINPNASIGSVTGASPLCEGSISQYFANAIILSGGSGSWSSSNPSVASVNAVSGIVTTLDSGSVDIIYTITGGCGGTVSAQQTLIVNLQPTVASVSGNSTLCIGQVEVYTANSVVLHGGTPAWSSSDPSIATVDNFGNVTGISQGTCNIVFTITGSTCSASAQQSVTIFPNASIGSVSGTNLLCIGNSVNYTANSVVLGGGTGSWSSSNSSVASVNASTGLVTAISGGTINIIYTITGGCGGTISAQQALTVNIPPSVASVTGSSPLCIGQNTSYTANSVVLNGGTPTWSSSNPAIATVNSVGLVTGIAPGTCSIIYTIINSPCTAVSAQQSVTILPNASVGSVSGTSPLCLGQNATYIANSVVLAGGTGSWSSSNTSVATVNASSGFVTAISGGTTNIIYTITGGCGATISAQQALTVNNPPSIASVTGTSPLCIGQNTTYTANSVVLNGGTANWSSINPAIATVNSSGVVSGISAGTCSIIYTISAGPCSASAQKTITILPNASVGTITGTSPMCTNSSATYAANSAIYSGGSGTWSSTNPAVATVNASTGLVSAISAGSTNIIYTITGGCGGTVSSSRTLIVNAPTIAYAGPNQTLPMCVNSAILNATSAPSPGNGTWTIIPAGPTFSPNNTTANATVNGLTLGVNYFLTWSVSNTGCAPASDQMALSTIAPIANAGPNQSSCQSTFTLDATVPESGFTGLWSCIGCNGTNGITISNPSSPTTTVNNFDPGESVSFTWTVSGTCTYSDQVTITSAIACNDDACGALPLAVNSGSCFYSVQSNTGATLSTGMVEPGCGSFSNSTSKDVWFTATVPANGVLTVQTVDAFGGGIMQPAIAFYTGTCDNLSHAGCASTNGTTVNTYTGTPGETIFIRVWDSAGLQGSFNICILTHTNAMSAIVSGNTTLICGSSYSFTDPGGNGNYLNNQSSFYQICPSEPGTYVSVDFASFNLGSGDNLIIFDGSNSNDPIIGQYTATSSPGIITSSNADGCLSFAFHSNNTIVASGWNATVSCSIAAGTNSYLCSSANCAGNCGEWLCGSGTYSTENAAITGVNDITNQSSGCFADGEISSKWFYFQAETTGFLEFRFDGPGGQDYNFAIWGPTTDYTAPCPTAGESPIRCSYANALNPVGLGNGATEYYEDAGGDGWVAPLNVIAGETYAMLLNIYQNGTPQPIINLTMDGTGSLNCTPVFLPITLLSFGGNNDGATNELYWVTSSEHNNDYFTLERSVNGFTWEIVTNVAGAGNSSEALYYAGRDENPYFPITYYRLKQTDYDGKTTISKTIVINGQTELAGDFISSIFPNPSAEYVTFVFNGKDTETSLNVQLINEIGQVVSEHTFTSLYLEMPATIETIDLSEGMYHVIFTQGTECQIQKLVIIH